MKKQASIFGPTLLERTIDLSRLPYAIGIVLVAVFIGPLGNFLYLYSISQKASSALYGTIISAKAEEYGFIEAIQSNWYSFLGNVLWYAFLFYVAFLINHLRTRLARAEPKLMSLAPNGEEDVRKVFNVISRSIPQLLITLIFLFVYATSVPELIGKGELNAYSTPIFILRSLVRSLMFGSVLWLYGGALWGLYRFGRNGLKLKPCNEDPMLGAKTLGSLSFAFSSAFFFGLILFVGQMAFGGLAGQTSIVNIILMLFLVPIGIILFVAPLKSTHDRMVEAKKAEIELTDKRLSELVSRIRESGVNDDQNMIKLLTLETAERKATSIKTWPVENPLIGKLALITASVAATLIARLIQILLQI